VLKRFIAAAFISALAVVGVAPAAGAATGQQSVSYSSHSNIDWD
jgi:hypothetical protein